MKKLIAVLLSLMLICAASAALADGLTFTTGGAAGTYYAFGTVLANYVSNNTDVKITAVVGNGSADNIDALDLGDAQLAFVQNDVANYAYNGIRFQHATRILKPSKICAARTYPSAPQDPACISMRLTSWLLTA